MIGKTLYRYDGVGSSTHCTKFKVISETPCGYWVKEHMCDKKWVSKTGKKRLCYPTKKEALYSLVRRREAYIRILNKRIDNSKDIIFICELELRNWRNK